MKDGNIIVKKQNKTNSGKVIFKQSGEEPALARKNWALWKLCKDSLTCEDIQALISIKKHNIKHESNYEKIHQLKTDIALLEQAYLILKRKEENKRE